MEINDRIALLKEHFGLSNTEFSERIKVQPSALSHIFSGRNRPSIDFILKIKHAFPHVSLNWLLLGEGSIEEEKHLMSEKNKTPTLFSSLEEDYTILEKIVFFYKNGTFKIYNP
ncbi:MAG: helix-turn-helix domain-containing protein [Flavobacteriales bacterium]